MPSEASKDLDELLAARVPDLRRFFRSRGVHNPFDLDDLVQNTELSALKALGNLRNVEALTRWVYKIAQNQLYDYWRRLDRTHEPIDSIQPNREEYVSKGEQGETLQMVSESIRVPAPLLRSVPLLADELSLTPSEKRALLDLTCLGSSQWGRYKAIERLESRLRLRRAVAALWNPDEAPDAILAMAKHLRGGPLERIYVHASAFREREEVRLAVTPAFDAIMDVSFKFVSNYLESLDIEAFRNAYCLQRAAALLSPRVLLDHYGDNQSLVRAACNSPLCARLTARMQALTGNPNAVFEQHQYWRRLLCEDVPDSELVFAAGYCAMYFAPPTVGSVLLREISNGCRSLLPTLHSNRAVLHEALITEAFRNTREPWYQFNQLWKEVNFMRMHLAIRALRRGQGCYGGLPSNRARQVWRIAQLAQDGSSDKTLRHITSGVISTLERLHGYSRLRRGWSTPVLQDSGKDLWP